jgi:hypothetical protein
MYWVKRVRGEAFWLRVKGLRLFMVEGLGLGVEG